MGVKIPGLNRETGARGQTRFFVAYNALAINGHGERGLARTSLLRTGCAFPPAARRQLDCAERYK